MNPRNIIEEAIKEANNDTTRVRVEMICPKFSFDKTVYKIKYDANSEAVYILDPCNSNSAYRFDMRDFEKLDVNVKVLSKDELQKEIDAIKAKEERLKQLQTFTFKDFLKDNGLSSIEDVVVQYKGVEYMLKPAMPMLFDVEMKKGTSGKVYMISEEQRLETNLKDLAELIKEESAFVRVKE